MLSDATKQKIDDAVSAANSEGYTFCGFAVNSDATEVQPFSNQDVIAEYVYNLLTGAAMIADGMFDTAAITDAADKFLKQAQNTKINEA